MNATGSSGRVSPVHSGPACGQPAEARQIRASEHAPTARSACLRWGVIRELMNSKISSYSRLPLFADVTQISSLELVVDMVAQRAGGERSG